MAIEYKFIFDDEEVAKAFLGYMSDGGGEYQFMELAADRFNKSVGFDYRSLNNGKFGPVVKVSVIKDE